MVGIRELPYYLRSYTYKHNKLNSEELFSELQHKLESKIPFAAGKIGGFELWAMRAAEFGYRKEYLEVYDKLCNNAGFFSDANDIVANLERYSNVMKDAISNVDYLIRWQYSKEEYFIRKYCSNDLRDIDWLGAVYQGRAVGSLFKGRKILVVTPFDKLVEYQYSRRELIYPEEFLPEFDLQTYRAVQTIAGNKDDRFRDWFEALKYMSAEICAKDFDLALVGCGAYSLPLCAAIKESGKSAIHMGGDVQLIFGIMGKRWENDPFVLSKKNEYWIYPGAEDIPKNADNVEDGCYW